MDRGHFFFLVHEGDVRAVGSFFLFSFCAQVCISTQFLRDDGLGIHDPVVATQLSRTIGAY